jgi:ribosomal protein L11 methyltransferase
MGFGTGHHATTRLCLAALQELDLEGAAVLDVGTGSGILAIAAVSLGARHAHAIDHDPDAVQSAQENLALNPGVGSVTIAIADLDATRLPESDVVTANLTGAVLIRYADPLIGAVKPGGTLIVSGILAPEEDLVRRAFATASLVDRRQEDEWACLILKKP